MRLRLQFVEDFTPQNTSIGVLTSETWEAGHRVSNFRAVPAAFDSYRKGSEIELEVTARDLAAFTLNTGTHLVGHIVGPWVEVNIPKTAFTIIRRL